MSWRHKSLDKFCILPSGYNGIITFVRWQRTAKSSPYSSLFGDCVGACAAADARCGFGRAFGGVGGGRWWCLGLGLLAALAVELACGGFFSTPLVQRTSDIAFGKEHSTVSLSASCLPCVCISPSFTPCM